MSPKLDILAFPDGRKEPENGYLSQLVHLLHEHTIDSLLVEPPTRFDTERFFSSTSIERRSSTIRILRKIVEDSATDKKQLQVLSELESLRSTIENIPKEGSVRKLCPSMESLHVTLRKLLGFISEGRSWLIPDPRLSSTDLEAFEQFGGLFVLIDILFLDRRVLTLGPEYIEISYTKSSRNVRLKVLWILNELLDHRAGARSMFRRSQALLNFLADTYRASSDKDDHLMRTSIASIFRSLAEPDEPPSIDNTVVYRTCRIVRFLTEIALECHADKSRTDELISTLDALAALVYRNYPSREDFLAVEGSMDMVIDLFGDRREFDRDYPFGHKGNRYDWVLNCVPNRIISRFPRLNNSPKQLMLAGDILVFLVFALHQNRRALERFRSRDVCKLLVLYLDARPSHKPRYWKAFNILGNMIDCTYNFTPIVDVEIEKKRLIELDMKKRIKQVFSQCKEHISPSTLEEMRKRNYLQNFKRFIG